jgi:hypothetical protein
MELTDILTVSVATLIVVVLSHLAVFYVVKTLYPPAPVAPPVYVPMAPPAPPVYTPPAEDVQHVSIPTHIQRMPAVPPREEDVRRGPPPPEATSIHGNSGVDTPNA